VSLARANDKLVDDVEALRKVDFHEEERRVSKSRRQSGDKTKNVKKTSKVTKGKSVRKDDPANAVPWSSSDDSASGSSPTSSDNFAYDRHFALRHVPRLNREYGPYTYLWPKTAQASLIGSDPSVPVLRNGFLVTLVQHAVLRRLVTTTEEATVVIPQWTNTSWYATAIRACFEYQVFSPTDARGANPTPWAKLACHCRHRYND